MNKKLLLLFFIAFTVEAVAQRDSLTDVFPLVIGNKWTYGYHFEQYSYPSHNYIKDTGNVEYELKGMISTVDSIRWKFLKRRTFSRTTYDRPNTPQYLLDSTAFEIVELNSGDHELYTPVYDAYDCFPFQKCHAESARIYRYMRVDSTGHAARDLQFQVIDPYNPYYFRDHYSILIKENTGVVRNLGDYGGAHTYLWVRYYFKWLENIITNVRQSQPERANIFMLSQNFPNPWNPVTQIRYTLSENAHVILKVYDVLGRIVSTLVEEDQSVGYKSIEFSGAQLPAGIYYYQLTAGTSTETKKMILIK